MRVIGEYTMITAATFVVAAAVYFFLIPSGVSVGSISGLAMLLGNVIPLPISVLTFILNAALLVVGFLFIGREFGVKTVYTSLILPVFLWVFEQVFPDFVSINQDAMMDTVCYIFVVSVGLALLFRMNASSGGLDIVAKLLNKYFHMELGKAMALPAVKTLNCVLDRMDQDWIPVEKSWRLNEKHYGSLQGLNKSETAQKYGDEQVLIWRRSYDIAPLPLSEDDPRNPRFDIRYKDVPDKELPRTESLKDTVERILPYWKEVIFPTLRTADQILVAAHGNSLRGIIKYLKNISDEEIVHLNLPTAVPYVFEFDDDLKLVNDYFLGDPEEIKKLMEAVANQGKKK